MFRVSLYLIRVVEITKSIFYINKIVVEEKFAVIRDGGDPFDDQKIRFFYLLVLWVSL